MEHKAMEGMMKGMKSMARPRTDMESKVTEPDYPTLRITEAMMPELKGMKVGDSCHFLMHAKLKGVPRSYGNGEVEYDFDLEKGDMVEMMKEEEEYKK